MDQEIVETLLAGGPAWPEPLGVRAYLVRHGEHFSGRAAGLERVPEAGLRPGNGRPVSTNELP
jgi:hypothetical protein